jgi:hypothetical protein
LRVLIVIGDFYSQVDATQNKVCRERAVEITTAFTDSERALISQLRL